MLSHHHVENYPPTLECGLKKRYCAADYQDAPHFCFPPKGENTKYFGLKKIDWDAVNPNFKKPVISDRWISEQKKSYTYYINSCDSSLGRAVFEQFQPRDNYAYDSPFGSYPDSSREGQKESNLRRSFENVIKRPGSYKPEAYSDDHENKCDNQETPKEEKEVSKPASPSKSASPKKEVKKKETKSDGKQVRIKQPVEEDVLKKHQEFKAKAMKPEERPPFALYGWANQKPVNPNHLLYTFNANIENESPMNVENEHMDMMDGSNSCMPNRMLNIEIPTNTTHRPVRKSQVNVYIPKKPSKKTVTKKDSSSSEDQKSDKASEKVDRAISPIRQRQSFEEPKDQPQQLQPPHQPQQYSQQYPQQYPHQYPQQHPQPYAQQYPQEYPQQYLQQQYGDQQPSRPHTYPEQYQQPQQMYEQNVFPSNVRPITSHEMYRPSAPPQCMENVEYGQHMFQQHQCRDPNCTFQHVYPFEPVYRKDLNPRFYKRLPPSYTSYIQPAGKKTPNGVTCADCFDYCD